MSEFLMVSENLEIKELSTGIKASSNEENIEHDDTVVDEGLDINEDTTSPFKEDAANDEPLHLHHLHVKLQKYPYFHQQHYSH